MTGRADLWIRHTTIGCVGLLALIAGAASHLHIHTLVALHGQPAWVAGLTPLSVDGMIVAASTPLLADSRSGSKGCAAVVATHRRQRGESGGQCGRGRAYVERPGYRGVAVARAHRFV